MAHMSVRVWVPLQLGSQMSTAFSRPNQVSQFPPSSASESESFLHTHLVFSLEICSNYVDAVEIMVSPYGSSISWLLLVGHLAHIPVFCVVWFYSLTSF